MIQTRKYLLLTVAFSLSVTACEDIHQPRTEIPPPEEHLRKLVAVPRGFTMAVGDKDSLTIAAYNLYGDVIPIPLDTSVPKVMFRSSDTARIEIDANGVMLAKQITSGTNPIRVFASWSYRGTTKADTAYVRVTATRPAKSAVSLSIQPAANDSAILGFGLTKTLAVQAYASDSTPIENVYAYIESDRARRYINDDINPITRVITIKEIGKMWVYAQSSVYGVLLRDSVEWVGTNPISLTVSVQSASTSSPTMWATRYLAPCGVVTVGNDAGGIVAPQPIVVEISDPTQTGQCRGSEDVGDIGRLEFHERAVRVFPNKSEVVISYYDANTPRKLLGRVPIIIR